MLQRMLAILLLLLFLAPVGTFKTPADAQEECSAQVQAAVAQLLASCADTAPNEVCYGAGAVQITVGDALEPHIFTTPGERAAIEAVIHITSAPYDPATGELGLALLRLPTEHDIAASAEAVEPSASVMPPAPAGVTVTPTGGTVSTGGALNLRAGPGTNYEVQGTLTGMANVVGQATGTDGYIWYQLESGVWARSDVVSYAAEAVIAAPAAATGTLDVYLLGETRLTVAPTTHTLVLQTGSGPLSCAGLPPHSAFIRAPEGTETGLRLNGAALWLNSGIVVTRDNTNDQRLNIGTLYGGASVQPPEGPSTYIPATYSQSFDTQLVGTLITIQNTAGGATQIYTSWNGSAQPYHQIMGTTPLHTDTAIQPHGQVLAPNQSQQYNCQGIDQNGFPTPIMISGWEAGNGTITSTGQFTGNESGAYYILCYTNGFKHKSTDSVILSPDQQLSGLSLSVPNTQMSLGEQQTVSATVNFPDGSTLPVSAQWSANGGLAIEETGYQATLTATAEGTYEITVTLYLPGDLSLTDTVPVSVTVAKSCGNGVCEPPQETPLTCFTDCDIPGCGDGKCSGIESFLNCPTDCPADDGVDDSGSTSPGTSSYQGEGEIVATSINGEGVRTEIFQSGMVITYYPAEYPKDPSKAGLTVTTYPDNHPTQPGEIHTHYPDGRSAFVEPNGFVHTNYPDEYPADPSKAETYTYEYPDEYPANPDLAGAHSINYPND
ncbi:MAG: hypothetical protein K8S97_05060, partial [Anaerolineae bacterium]|nr:hypothetical protein [Anaerolineae bacterium]